MENEKMTLEEIIEREKKSRTEGGAFGIAECKIHISWWANYTKKSLYEILEAYVKSANEDPFFNKHMVLACWELINEK